MNKWVVLPGAVLALGLCGACGLEHQYTVPPPKQQGYVPATPIPSTPAECTYQISNPYRGLSVQPDATQSGLWDVYVGGHQGSIGSVSAQTSSDALSKAFEVEITTCTSVGSMPDTQQPYSQVPISGSTGSTGNTGNSG